MIYDFSLLNIPFANGAPSNEIAPFPDYDRGLGIAFDQTDGKPEMKGLNGLFQQMTLGILYLRQRGIGEWNQDFEYVTGSFVVLDGALYKAIRDNINKNPATSQTDWQLWASVSDITVSTNGNLKKTTNANGAPHLEVPTANTIDRGVMRFATATEVVNKSATQAAITAANAATVAQSTDIGIGQTWRDVTSSRAVGVTYTNNTAKPIQVIVSGVASNGTGATLTLSGITLKIEDDTGLTSFIVPPGGTYSITRGFTISKWAELR